MFWPINQKYTLQILEDEMIIKTGVMAGTCVLASNSLAWLRVQRLCCASWCHQHAHTLGCSQD